MCSIASAVVGTGAREREERGRRGRMAASLAKCEKDENRSELDRTVATGSERERE